MKDPRRSSRSVSLRNHDHPPATDVVRPRGELDAELAELPITDGVQRPPEALRPRQHALVADHLGEQLSVEGNGQNLLGADHLAAKPGVPCSHERPPLVALAIGRLVELLGVLEEPMHPGVLEDATHDRSPAFEGTESLPAGNTAGCTNSW